MPSWFSISAQSSVLALALFLAPAPGGSLAAPAGQAAPEVPAALAPPAGEQLVTEVHAKGSQIYVCSKEGSAYAWTFKGPEAQLFDKGGRIVGRHHAGPTWEWNDGSEVTAKMVASAPSPDPGSIPWLLLAVTTRSGSGVLTRASSIQRLNTKGGKPPVSSCNVVHENDEVQMSYSADYFFFGK